MWLWFIRGEYKKSCTFYMLLFLFATDHRNVFCRSWSQGISQKSHKEICVACLKSMLNLFSWIVGAWYWKSAILSTALRSYHDEDIWPIRAWYQNMVSWNSGVKGMSPGSAALFPSPGYCSAHFARRYFSYLFFPFSPTAEPGPRLMYL